MLIAFAIIVVLIPLIIFLIDEYISYSTHVYMVRRHSVRFGYGSFEQFKEQFFKIDSWTSQSKFDGSFFSDKTDSEYHADIICFNNIGMIMNTPLDWFLVKRFMKKFNKEYTKQTLYKW
jgi:hypothetical protein